MEAVLLLESACNAHAGAATYPFLLQLIDLYHEFSAFEPAIQLYNKLEIKQIQLETLSPLVLDGCYDSGFFVEALSQCDAIIAFHRDAAREASDHAVHALDSSRPLCAMKLLHFQAHQMRPAAQLAFAQAGQRRRLPADVSHSRACGAGARRSAAHICSYCLSITASKTHARPSVSP